MLIPSMIDSEPARACSSQEGGYAVCAEFLHSSFLSTMVTGALYDLSRLNLLRS